MLKTYSNKSSSVAEMGDRGHNRHGPKRGGGAAVPLSWGELGPHLAQCGWAQTYLHAKWHLDPSSRLATTGMSRKLGVFIRTKWHLHPSSRLATIDTDRKWGRSARFWGRGVGPPSSTMWPVPRPTSTPSGILNHPAV